METTPLRRPLAIVFCDIQGTTAMIGRIGDLAVSTVLRDFYEQTGRLSRDLSCVSLKFIGDGFLAAFKEAAEVVPLAHAVQDAFRSLPALDGRGLAFRFSLHFADVLCVETSYGKDILGEEVNLAARLNGLAEAGQIVVSQAAFDHLPADQQALAGAGEAIRLRSRRASGGRGRSRGDRRHRDRQIDAGSEIMIHRIALLVP